MRIILAILVAVILFAAVGIVRYDALVAQDDRAAESRNANCRRDIDLRAYPYGDPVCMRRAHETTMAERSISHYIFGAWLWGALAGLVGGVLTFIIAGRRRRPSAAE